MNDSEDECNEWQQVVKRVITSAGTRDKELQRMIMNNKE